MKISDLTYEQVREDMGLPPICTGCTAWSANEHYRGMKADGRMHWSRSGMRRSGLHAFVRAGLRDFMDWQYVHEASVEADRKILELYLIRIPASASKWERRHVLATARGSRLRTTYPSIYAWATYTKESK